MKKFIIRLFFLFVVAFLSVEVYIRVNHLTIDVPQRQINEHGIQLYNPSQEGFWANGSHTWEINQEGWPGKLPVKMDSLITLIGDSHIENFMNPPNCNLGNILNAKRLHYNFFPAGRSGVSLIEAMEISKFLADTYKPVKQFVFVKESDLKESIQELGISSDITQFNLTNKVLVNGELKSPGLKKIFYNIKTLYFFRNVFASIKPGSQMAPKEKYKEVRTTLSETDSKYYNELLKYINEKYNANEITFFLHPETIKPIEDLFIKHHLKYYKFKAGDNLKWRSSPTDEAHWSCYGNEQAAEQIVTFLKI